MMEAQCKYIVRLKNALPLHLLTVCLFLCPLEAKVPSDARQLITAISADWNTHRGVLQCWECSSLNHPWKPKQDYRWPVLFGRHGLAWGRGVFVPPHDQVPWKREKDGRAPAGIFELGRIYGEQPKLPDGANWPYVQIGRWDAWVDDPKLPQYNQHVRVDPNAPPSWFESQRMRLGDSAYKWLVEIRHNRGPIAPGYGSAIFFHVRRGPDRPSSGCTTMELANLEKMIRWIRWEKKPYYVLLPQAEYDALRQQWGLP